MGGGRHSDLYSQGGGLVMNHEGGKGKKNVKSFSNSSALKVFAMAMGSRESEGRFRSQSLETPSVF